MRLGQALCTLPLEKSMQLYVQKLQRPISPFQYEDWLFVWDKMHSCICRSRGGSKTKDFVDWIVFRVLRTHEKWAWIAAKGGQLTQSYQYFLENKFVKGVKYVNFNNTRKMYFELVDGQLILFSILNTALLGLRLDGLIIDEEENLEPKQSEEEYPQMIGMFTCSKVGHMIHLGTLWMNTRFAQNCEQYPTVKRPWNTIPHLLQSNAMKHIIEDKNTPEWEKDLLYRCILTAPSGLVFPSLIIEDATKWKILAPEEYGLDFGATDHCVGGLIQGQDVYVLMELEVELERAPQALDFIKGQKCEAECGGYNDSDKYAAKSRLMQSRIGCMLKAVTNKWKSERMMKGRQMRIHIDPNRTPKTYADLRGLTYDKDGLYLKDAKHPCHWVDAFLHMLEANKMQYLSEPDNELLLMEQRRQREYQRSKGLNSSRSMF